MSIDKRIRDGLRTTNDALPTPDLDRALSTVTAGRRPTRRRTLVVGLAAAAAVAAAVATVAVVPSLIDRDGSAPPVGPSPSPTVDPSRTTAPVAMDGSIYFAADGSAGSALTDPVTFGQVELHPRPMDIYLSRRGEPVRRIIATRAHERCPVVSPDGSRLAYLEGPAVVIVPLDADGSPGAPEVRVDLESQGLYRPSEYRAGNSAGTACPQWSPDGSRLGYQVTIGDPNANAYETVTAQVHAVSLDGVDRVLTSFETSLRHSQPDFAWSPDGKAVAYTTLDGVWRVRLDGGTPELVWRTPEGHPSGALPSSDGPVSLAWSSKGELAFTVLTFVPTDPSDPLSGGNDTFRLVVVDAGSGEVRLETEGGSVLEGGAGEGWSPDGSLLVFAGPDGQIVLYDRATGSTDRVRPRLRGGAGVDVRAPRWSPDGRALLARAGDSDRGIALVSFAIDGSSVDLRTPWTWALDWASIDDVDWSSR